MVGSIFGLYPLSVSSISPTLHWRQEYLKTLPNIPLGGIHSPLVETLLSIYDELEGTCPKGAAATLQAEQGHLVQDQIFWEPKFFKRKPMNVLPNKIHLQCYLWSVGH